ncbi:DnaJ-like protein [Hydrogenoanaerobacterium saccharovorans]|uniref:DnaJ domain-containing protein n=1 Tax=Hydrogenoanaerobacterium saccharovorans TaxID=474960 RepID=A0A1H7ZD70_9FIRM|nr:DnaJ domain-containing protein [Hydrogenoanaerobacterium saccharovorans]RPF48671.1 DnaJ-like protein [Hydrogenoanaerobacterium saccharovorans]SEM56350.1 DnaJ domain-containing protein [Hydrogenoanaerobacterium saccharovorans]
MTDPYKVLGVSPNASDDEIKTAYREMARKYHPDNYANNPLSDLASEKMKEINEAYDAITAQRKGANQYQGGYNSGTYASSGSQFADIRRMIQNGRIEDAAEVLDGVPNSNRDAEWYFLKGSVLYTRGWLDQAYRHMSQAVNMAPSNPEYRAALNQMMWQRNNGTNQSGSYRTAPTAAGCSGCDMCTSLICADCCCECMGGDLIRCC